MCVRAHASFMQSVLEHREGVCASVVYNAAYGNPQCGLWEPTMICCHTPCNAPLTAQVPSEEAIVEIRERYLEINWHAKSYTWKSLLRQPDGKCEDRVFVPSVESGSVLRSVGHH